MINFTSARLFACTLIASAACIVGDTASADILCQLKNAPKQVRASTRVQAIKMTAEAVCPRGYRKVGEILSATQIKTLATSISNEALSSVVTSQEITNLIEARLDGAIPGVTYKLGPINFSYGSKSAVAFANARLTDVGTWHTRVVLRTRDSGDETVYASKSLSLLNKECEGMIDAGTVDTLAATSCNLSVSPVVTGFIGLAGGSHKLPVLRLIVGSNATAKCSQFALDEPHSDTFSSVTADATGKCPWGDRSVRASVKHEGNGVPSPGKGESIMADSVTMNKICQIRGYDGYSSYQRKRYDSCGDNKLYRWIAKSNKFVRVDACDYNYHLDALTCYKFE
jgi:hypothetical protein